MKITKAIKLRQKRKNELLSIHASNGWRDPDDVEAEKKAEEVSVREDDESCTGLVVFSE